MKRTCKKCDENWVIDPIGAEFFRGKATGVPRVCTSCRATSRSFEDTSLRCEKCETQFSWPKELALYATMFDWKEPCRCPGGCNGEREEMKRFRGDMSAIGPVWLRVVENIDLDAAPSRELTTEQQLRETKIPKLDDLFKGLGSGMSTPTFEGNITGTPSARLSKPTPDELPPEILPSPDSLFGNLKKQ